ncbi:autotransporter outer membrane beta-barrel domain-containing protein, partial [Bradyrhizobium sp. AUGA SZCCT0160]|uniref:autotransporter outer membrane beta-barrel domain-containing protein n=1 Tax=Bradyrhizobium sp. AUGA SZCCT0160 TaxID=2807662 RepID=UPI001BAAD479
AYVARRYTIVNAAGGVNGTFGSVANTNLPAGFVSSLSYDAQNAYLDLNLTFSPGFANGLNGNQTAVANALINSFNTTGGIPLVFGTLTPAGLTQVSGEAATGTQQTTFDAMEKFINVMTDPFTGTRSGGAPPAGATGYADENEALAYAARKGRNAGEREAYAKMAMKAPPLSFERRWSVWGAGYGGTQSTDGNAAVGSNSYTSRIYGGAAGLDYRVAPGTLVGFSLGGAGTKYDLVNGLGGGRSEMFQAGVYGRHDIGAAYLAGALAYGWQDVTTDRIALLNSYRAKFDANALSGRLEGGYRYAFGTSGLTPYAAGQFTTLWLPNYTEQVVAGVNTFA